MTWSRPLTPAGFSPEQKFDTSLPILYLGIHSYYPLAWVLYHTMFIYRIIVCGMILYGITFFWTNVSGIIVWEASILVLGIFPLRPPGT